MKPMTALLFVNIVVLTVWTVIDPLYRDTVVVAEDHFFREVETYGELSIRVPSCASMMHCTFRNPYMLFTLSTQASVDRITWGLFLVCSEQSTRDV